MRIHALGRLLTAAALLTVMLPASVVAAEPAAVTYHGSWTGGAACGLPLGTFTGVWNVTLKQDGSASVSARIFENGKIHAAWGGQYFGQAWQQAAAGGRTFVLTNDGFLSLVLTLDGTSLTYQLTDYCTAMGLGTGSAFVYGQLDR